MQLRVAGAGGVTGTGGVKGATGATGPANGWRYGSFGWGVTRAVGGIEAVGDMGAARGTGVGEMAPVGWMGATGAIELEQQELAEVLFDIWPRKCM